MRVIDGMGSEEMPDDLKMSQAGVQECVALLEQCLADAKAGKVTSVAVVACGPSDFGAAIAGLQAAQLNLGLDVLKARIRAGVMPPPAAASPIIRPGGRGPRRS